MKKRILIAALTAAMASSIFGVTVNAADRELNINWLSSRSASESAILAIQDIAKQYRTTVNEILTANELSDQSAAAVGELLLIPRRR